jgi:hypothetical protein
MFGQQADWDPTKGAQDKDGCPFICRDPGPFPAVLTYLRTGYAVVPVGSTKTLVEVELEYYFDQPPPAWLPDALERARTRLLPAGWPVDEDTGEPKDCRERDKQDRVLINVRGRVFETTRATVCKHAGPLRNAYTMLHADMGSLAEHFVDEDPVVFAQVLNVMSTMSPDTFDQEKGSRECSMMPVLNLPAGVDAAVFDRAVCKYFSNPNVGDGLRINNMPDGTIRFWDDHPDNHSCQSPRTALERSAASAEKVLRDMHDTISLLVERE